MSGVMPAVSETMDKIAIDKVKTISEKKGLKPGRVKGLTTVQITKGTSPSIEIITWDEFQTALEKKKLAVYEYNGFMKIMRA